MKMTLEQGRPHSNEGRLDKEIRCYDMLDSLGIEFWRVDHEIANTMEICKAIDEVLGATICKNLFLCNRQKTRFFMLMMPEDKPFKTKEITKQIGSARLSFGPEEKMEEFLDITPGSVSVLGLMNDKANNVQLVVDEDVLKGEFVGCHPCINTSSLKIRTKDLFERFLPTVHHEYMTVRLTGEA